MRVNRALPAAAFAGAVLAQNNSTTGLVEVIDGQDDLSVLGELLSNYTVVLDRLQEADNITILAPSNDALNSLLNSTTLQDAEDMDGLVAALLSYHVLNGTYYAANVTNSSTFIPTLLNNSTYENVTGPQVVEVLSEQGDDDETIVSFYSALKAQANVTTADIEFDGGVIHIINDVLTIPLNLTATAIEGSLSAVAGALNATEQGPTLDELEDVTIFAPNNDAFAAIGSLVANLTTDDLSSILEYHVINGTVLYSSDLSNGTQATLGGEDVNITISEEGTVYVNAARVVVADILIANGVVHVIDNVLNPNGTDTENEPNPSSTVPAFPDASTATDGGVPFTSGIPTPTETSTDLNEGEGEGEGQGDGGDDEGAAPRATAAVAMGALFGGAAILMNGL